MPAGSVSVDVNGNFVPFEKGWTAVAGRLFTDLVVPPANMDRFTRSVDQGVTRANRSLGSLTTGTARGQLQSLERAQAQAARSSAALAAGVRGLSSATAEGARVQATYQAMLDAQLGSLVASTAAAEADTAVRRAREAALAGEVGATAALDAAVAKQTHARGVATAAAAEATAAETAFMKSVDAAAAASVRGAGSVRVLADAHRDAAAAAGVDAAARQQQLAAIAAAQQKAARSQALMIGGAASVYGGVKIYQSLNDAVQAAAELNDTVGFSRQVFGDAYPEIERFADGAAKAIGQSRQQATSAATSFAQFGKMAGLSGRELADYSTELVKLASDMKAAVGGSVDQALTAIQSGLAGTSTEPLRQYGITITELMVKEEARRRGLIKDTTGVLPQNIRALATQSLIMRQAGDIVGQYAREYDELPARQERVRASLENLKVEIGEGALPAFEALVGVAERAVGTFTALPDAVQKGVGTAGAVLGALAIGGGALALVAGGYNQITAATDRLRERIGTIGPEGERSFGRAGRAARGFGAILAGLAIADIIGSIANEIGNFDKKVDDAIKDVIASAGQGGIDALAAFREAAKNEESKFELGDLFRLPESIFGTFELAGTEGGRITATYAKRAFDQVLAQSPELAQKLANELRAANEEAGRSSEHYDRNADLLAWMQEQIDRTTAAQKALTGATDDQTGALGGLGDAIDDTVGGYERLATAARDALSPALDVMRSRLDIADARVSIEDAQQNLQDVLTYNTDGIKAAREALVEARKALAKARSETGPWSEAADRARKEAQSAEDRLLDIRREMAKAIYDREQRNAKIARGELDDLGPALFEVDYSERLAVAQRDLDRANREVADIAAGRSEQVRNAQERVADATRRLNEEMAKAGPGSREAADAQRDYERAVLNGLEAQLDQNDAIARLRDLMVSNPGIIAENETAIRRLAEAIGLSADETQRLIDNLRTAGREAGPVLPAHGIVPFFRGPGNEPKPPAWDKAQKHDPTPNDSVGTWTPAHQKALRQQNDEFTRLSKAGQKELAEWLLNLSVEEYARWKRMLGQPIPGFARGGIFDDPTLGIFGEAGREALIPLEGNRAQGVRLWEQAGRELGMFDPAPSSLLSRTRGGDGASTPPAPAQAASTSGEVVELLRTAVRLLGEARMDVTIHEATSPRRTADEVVQAQKERGWAVAAGAI